MSPSWRVDKGWTGDWPLPELLRHPVAPEERHMLVAASCGGVPPGRIARELGRATSIAEATDSLPRRCDPQRRMKRLTELGVRVLVPSDEEYPEELREIAAPPPLLYVRGTPLTSLRPCVAVVGARACSRGARAFAHRIGAALAAAGFAIVSGLARGIDAAAHRGALEEGRTVAVLGTGIELIYPAEHRELSEEIVRSGVLLTEFPPGTTPKQWHFPARNRIVAGLSIAVVVVEAALGSGALITAGFALDQGREVFACITGPDNPAGAGLREMIRDGARLVVDPGDLVCELRDLAAAQGYELPEPGFRGSVTTPELDGAAAKVYGAVTEDTTLDEIAATTGLPTPTVAAVAAMLQLDGLLDHDGHGTWRRGG